MGTVNAGHVAYMDIAYLACFRFSDRVTGTAMVTGKVRIFSFSFCSAQSIVHLLFH